MKELARLAGFFAAHGIWCVSDGETLIPILAVEDKDGSRFLNRIESEELQESVRQGKVMLEQGIDKAVLAVLVYDSFVTLPSGKTDALTIEGRDYFGGSTLNIIVPYRQASSQQGFAVYKPKFLTDEAMESMLIEIGQAFFEGVNGHDKGSAIWAGYLDESI